MKQYQHSFQVKAPLETVADFHKNPDVLGDLVPPPLRVKPNLFEPIAEGSTVDFNLTFGPISIRWVAEHKNINFPSSFTDVQIKGPFKSWEHTHEFIYIDENITEVKDTVKAQPSSGGAYWFVSRFMWYTLPILFSFRAKRTKALVE